MDLARALVRGGIALTAFLLLFFAIVNASAGRYAWAGATLAAGAAGTVYLVRTRRVSE